MDFDCTLNYGCCSHVGEVTVEQEDRASVFKCVYDTTQGELEYDGTSLAGAHIGRVCGKGSSKAELVIGNQRIEGKRVALQKPFAVLERTGDSYAVVGVIRSKLLFDCRPRAMVQKGGAATSSKQIKPSKSETAAALFGKRKRENTANA